MILRRVFRENVRIRAGSAELDGVLSMPDEPFGVVLFSHAAGGDRSCARTQFMARYLQEAGFGTLLIDLLTPEEDTGDAPRFNIRVLADRLGDLASWLRDRTGRRLGYYGTSTGAAAAFVAAAERQGVAAIVSRGGRPDLSAAILADVDAPTLLIVGSEDEPVATLNRDASELLRVPWKLVVLPGTGARFEESGALEEVARHAADWFRTHLPERPLMP